MNKANYKCKITPEFVSKIQDIREAGASETDQRKFVREYLGVSKSWGNTIFLELKKFFNGVPVYGLEFASDRYVYNTNTDTYVINLKCKKDPFVISGAKHRAICRAYSSWSDDLSVNDICIKYSLTPEVFSEYKKIFKLTKDKEPLSLEEIATNSIDESVETLIEEKRYKIYQEYEKQSWKDIQLKANKWDDLNSNTLDFLRLSLDEWNPPEYKKVAKNKIVKDGLTFLAALSDNHIGELFKKEEAFYGNDFNTEIATQIIDDYSSKIRNTVESRRQKFNECLIVITGDYLHSCLDGNTRKGTHLHNDSINEKMFLAGLNTLIKFVESMLEIFPLVRVFTQKGNHESLILTYLAIAAEKYFKNNPNVKFEISSAWATLYRINNIAMIVTHGAHDELKKSLDPVGPKLKMFIQGLLLQKVDIIQGCTQKIVLSGHRHTFNQSDMGSFEFYCLGATVKGDNFADSLGLYSKVRQNCLIMDNDHVLETLHYFF